MKLRTPAQSAELDARLRVGIYSGKSPEELAPQLGTKPSYVYTLLRRRLGFERMLLDTGERQVIRERRAKMLTPPKRAPRPSAKG